MESSVFRFSSASTHVYFGGRFSLLKKISGKTRTILITDSNIHSAHENLFRSYDAIVLKPGESYKVQETADAVIRQLVAMEADRHTLLVGIGGGVVTDLTGYIASIYLRGLRFGFVPTSLLAMVDASIGGKNGVNVDDLKNIMGTIRQPGFILYDDKFLDSLPENEWRNGMAEVIKHACISGAGMFRELERSNLETLRSDRRFLREMIRRHAGFKLKLVQKDEFEKNERQLLNFGHTIGHALEARYELSHGEAVAIGMTVASRFSEKLAGFSDAARLQDLIAAYQLPTRALFDPDKILQSLVSDKKRKGGKINFILLNRIGKAMIKPIPIIQLKKMLVDFR